MKSKNLMDSFNYAIEGIIYTLKTQRNMRIHIIIAIIVLLLSLLFNLSQLEILVLFFTISLVIVAEMVNTAIEATIDLITNEYHELAKIAKNVAAGAVLIATINAIIVAYIIFFKQLNKLSGVLFYKVRSSPIHITFINLIIVVLIVIGLKAYFKTGTPLRGGMPSGHSAIAFSIVIIMIFLSKNVLVITLALLMAILVVQSRIEAGFHTLYEVIMGSLLGALITLLIFQLLF